VDGSEVYQVYHGHLTEQESYLYGYVTSGVVMFDNAVDHSTATTGSYVDVDITSDIGTDDATGAIVHLFQDTGAEVALRKNGVSHDQYWEVENHQYGIVEIDDQDIFEQKIFNANVDLFLTGYALQCAVSATTQYRSVGTNTGDLASGDGITVKATVSSGGTTVTFTGLSLPAMDQVGAMGPGDKITLDPGGANEDVRYILSRDSATQVTLQSAVSNDHTVAANQDFNITRAYNTLSGWESARQRDLTATTGDDAIEVAVCYKDGVLQEIDVVEIDGWTTAEDNYIRIWVPEGQRHTGTAGTGFVLKPNTTTPQEWFLIFWIDELYVRFEGIEIDGSDIENAQFVGGIDTGNVDGVGEIRVDKCLIHDLTNPTQASSSAYIRGISIANDRSSRITNNIIYNLESNTSASVSISAAGIYVYGTGSHYVYNNTVYNVGNGNASYPASGYNFGIKYNGSGGATIINNFAGGTYAAGSATVEDIDGGTQSYNISEDTTATGTGSQTGKSPADQFVSTTAGFENLHLKATADCINAANGLSATFTDDIDGDTRPTGAGTWDIGADENTGAAPSAALTGTLADGATEAQIVSGGETLIITLTNDTWDATIGDNNAKTTALINGIDSDGAEGTHPGGRGDLRHHSERDDYGHRAGNGGGRRRPDCGHPDL
jgi:hypothetical protein